MAVRCMLSPFGRDASDQWFTQSEATFSLQNITNDSQKANLVIGALDVAAIKDVQNVLDALPGTEK